MKAKLSQVVFSLLLAVALMLAVVSPALADAPARREAKLEVKFMKNMIDHHQMAVMMAEMCVEKAVHEELRTMCEDIITEQMAEIELFQSWLQDWCGVTYEPQMKPKDERMVEMLSMLEREASEIHFMDMMIEHHMMAIMMAEKCVDRAYHEDLISQCHMIIESQMEEIEMRQTWLCEWYGICKETM